MKRILITGAGGFVGPHLIKEILSQGDSDIFATVFNSNNDLSDLVGRDHVVAGDLSDPVFAKSLLTQIKPDIIYHLAALSVVHNSADMAMRVINSNATISYNLLEAVRLSNQSARFIAICSANVYGAVLDQSKPLNESTPLRPLNPYAVSKVVQEMLALQYCLAHKLNIVILRPFNHTGVGQTTDFLIPKLAKQFAAIEKGSTPPIIEIGNLDSIRDFTDVRDIARAYTMASLYCKSGETYNIGSGIGVTVADIISIFQSLSSVKVDIKVNKNLIRHADVPFLVSDTSKFNQITNYVSTISLKNTISDILAYWRDKS